MSDFAFLDRDPIDRIAARRKHLAEVLREGLKRKLSHVADDCEKATDYCRDLMKTHEDVSEELDELETTARALLLVALILKRENANG